MNLRYVRVGDELFLEELQPDGYWSRVPTVEEPKKVTVEEELANHLFDLPRSINPIDRTHAKAAVDFFNKKIDNLPYGEMSKADVRKTLFGEA